MEVSLFLVPTPIGNLADMTYRAVEILRSVDVILAEDTRTSARLMQHYEIGTSMRSFHMHNEHHKVDGLVEEMRAGRRMAVITDAGTPGISDPGYLIARRCIDAGLEVSTLAGATAFVPALVNSGLPAHRFLFEGFLPAKKGRKTRLEELAEETATLIFYESPYRLERTFRDLARYLGEDRAASFSREISKKFEETRRATLGELADWARNTKPRGEFVICVAGR